MVVHHGQLPERWHPFGLGAVLFKAGSGWPAGFDGNIDALIIGVSGDKTTFDFEPGAQCSSVCYVNGTTSNDANAGNEDSPKQTIQAAVNQVAGGTVHVADGTYAEQVLVTEHLTLIGAGEGASNVVPPADMAETPPSYGAGYTAQAQVSLGNAATMTMSGFTLDGPFPSEYGCGTDVFGIYVYGGATLNLSATTISDTHLTPKPALFGCQVGIGIWVGGLDGLSAGHATVTDVNITGYQKGGIVASGTGTSLDVSGSAIAGEGPTTLIAQNGIQVSDGATARIVSNTISGNFYSPNTYEACGLLLYKAGGVGASKAGLKHIASDNTFVGNEKDVCNFGKGGKFSPAN